MANVIVNPAEQATQEYDVYVKPLLDDPQIQALPFDIIVSKFVNRELYFNTQLDKISVKKVDCGWTFNGGATFTKKTVTPVEIAAAVEQCYVDLVNTIFAYGLPDGWERGTLSAEVIKFMLDQRQYAFNRDLLTTLFLGDEANGVAYYAMNDGIYKKLAAGAAAADGTVDANVTLNSTTLNATNFFATLKSIFDLQPRLLKGIPKNNRVWIWTESVYDAYTNYLYVSTQTNAGIIQRETVVNGIDETQFMGIPILVVPIVDERLEADFTTGSPLAVTDPYRVILTAPTNHKILLDADGLMKTNQWYNPDLDLYRMTGSALFDYEYGYGELNVYSGF